MRGSKEQVKSGKKQRRFRRLRHRRWFVGDRASDITKREVESPEPKAKGVSKEKQPPLRIKILPVDVEQICNEAKSLSEIFCEIQHFHFHFLALHIILFI